MKIPPLLFFVTISGVTTLVFLTMGAMLMVFGFFGQPDRTLTSILLILFLWKGLLVGLFTWFIYRTSKTDEFILRFIGMYLGRFFGILAGGALGIRIGDALKPDTWAGPAGMIAGALTLYFTGRWIGSRISLLSGRLVGRFFSVPEPNEENRQNAARRWQRILVIFAAFYPVLVLVTAWMSRNLGIIASSLSKYLPTARLAAIFYAGLIQFMPPLLAKSRSVSRSKLGISGVLFSRSSSGLMVSLFPALLGLILFYAFGASIGELVLFGLASSLSAMYWGGETLGKISR